MHMPYQKVSGPSNKPYSIPAMTKGDWGFWGIIIYVLLWIAGILFILYKIKPSWFSAISQKDDYYNNIT